VAVEREDEALGAKVSVASDEQCHNKQPM